MNSLKKLFPYAFKAKDLTGLIVALIIYIVVFGVLGAAINFLAAILPIIGFVIGIIGWAVGIYGAVGVILSVLCFLKIVK